MKTTIISATSQHTHDASSTPNPQLLTGKVHLIEAHPVLPYVAATFTDDNGSSSNNSATSTGVVIWDYSKQEILRHFTYSELTEWVSTFEAFSELAQQSGCGNRDTPVSGSSGRDGAGTKASASKANDIGGDITPSSATASQKSVSSMGSLSTLGQRSETADFSVVHQHQPLKLRSNHVCDEVTSSSGGDGGGAGSQTGLSVTTLDWDQATPVSSNGWHSSAPTLTNQSTPRNTVRLGIIRDIKFHDRQTLYWNSGKAPTVPSVPDPMPDESGANRGAFATSLQSNPLFIVLTEHRVVILRLRWFHSGPTLGSTSGRKGGIGARAIADIINPTDLSNTFPTAVQALTNRLLLIGCSDGTLKLYSLNDRRVVRSIKAHRQAGSGVSSSSHLEPVVMILSASRADIVTRLGMTTDDAVESGLATHTTSGRTNESSKLEMGTLHRIITIGHNGIAYLWNFSCVGSSLIRSPLPVARMYNVLIAQSKLHELSSGASTNATCAEFAYYDAEREFFIASLSNVSSGAAVGGGYSGGVASSSSSSKLVGLWDVSDASVLSISSGASTDDGDSLKGSVAVPILVPFLSLKITQLPECIFVPVNHPAYSDTSLTMYLGSRSGFSGSSNSLDYGEIAFLAAPLNAKIDGLKPEWHYQFGLGGTGSSEQTKAKVKIYAMAVPRFRSTLLVIGTNFGLVVAKMDETSLASSASRHASVGVAGGVLLVEGISVFAAALNNKVSNPVGSVGVRNPVLIYKSLSSTKSHVVGDRLIRRPPRLSISPSKTFLCILWDEQFRYEILHLDSVLRPRAKDGSFPPPVDAGVGVASFAWVGNDDTYVLLNMRESTSGKSVITPNHSGKHSRFDFKKKNKNKGNCIDISPGTSDKSNGSKFQKSYVEIKMLMPAKSDAAGGLLSPGIATATSRSLGILNVRGGQQPTNIFGGPVLAVESCRLSQGGEIDPQDAFAYFYCRRAIDTQIHGGENEKASSYAATGPGFPHPDIVEWSEDGNLCCVCVSTRISVYACKSPNFTLVGTSFLLSPIDRAERVESVKFIRGSLFCTSRTSIQCVFLGSEKAGGAATDSFLLASPEVSFAVTNPASFSQNDSRASMYPVPTTMSLICPHILTIYSGSLIVSTATGLSAVSLECPLLRIALLLEAGQYERAKNWFDAVEVEHHESLCEFLERRGVPELGLELKSLSVEMLLDVCLRYGLTSELENFVESSGVAAIRKTDFPDNETNTGYGAVVSVSALLLSKGKAELVRRIASESVGAGEKAREDAFMLACLMLAVDPNDAKRLLKRIIGAKGKENDEELWPVGRFAQQFLLK